MKCWFYLYFTQLELEEVRAGGSHKHGKEKFGVWFHLPQMKQQQISNKSKHEAHVKSLRSSKRAWITGSGLMIHHETSKHACWCVCMIAGMCQKAGWLSIQARPQSISEGEHKKIKPFKNSFTSEQTVWNSHHCSFWKMCRERRKVALKVNGIICTLAGQRVDEQFDRLWQAYGCTDEWVREGRNWMMNR